MMLLLGSTGMLGQALAREAARRKIQCLGVARSTEVCLDVTDLAALSALIEARRPTVVVNCVADVSLLHCEEQPGHAYVVNARPAGHLAALARNFEFYLVQMSTDHYYTGDDARAHSEGEPVTLLNEYARTKYAAEQLALTSPGACCVRTNIVGFRSRPGQPTFVEWVFQSLEQGAPVCMFTDYYTSSIDVATCARALFDLLPQRPNGVLNLGSREVSSKRDFILTLIRHLGRRPQNLSVGSLRTLAGPSRAESCGLDVSRAEALLGRSLPDLEEVSRRLAQEYLERRRG